MQVKFRRTTGSKGMLSKTVTYILEVVALPTADELELITRFGRERSMLRHLADVEIDSEDEVYNQISQVTFQQIQRGHQFVFEGFNSIIRTENATVAACKQLMETAEFLETFDGSERVFEVTSGGTTFVTAG